MDRLRMLSLRAIVACLLFLMVGCTLVTPTPDSTVPPVSLTPTLMPTLDPALVPALTPDVLADATYLSEFGSDGTITLRNGVYSAPAAPGSASQTLITMGWPPVFGDLNGDRIADAVVILVVNPGGSGTFYYLHAMINQNGAADNVAFNFLGDRIVLHSVMVDGDGLITVAAKRQGPDDSMCCPTQDVIQTYAVQGDKLPLLDEEIAPEDE